MRTVTSTSSSNMPRRILKTSDQITVTNRGPEAANLPAADGMVPQYMVLGRTRPRPELRQKRLRDPRNRTRSMLNGKRWLYCEGSPELLFTENETNVQRLFGADESNPVRERRDQRLRRAWQRDAVNPERTGTKAAAHTRSTSQPGETASAVASHRLTLKEQNAVRGLRPDLRARQREADEFYATVIPQNLSPDAQNVMRQAFAGMLWSKQFYHYVVKDWLEGDPGYPSPPAERKKGRNHEWAHLTTRTSSPCRTSGNIPGTPRGTWHSTAFRWRWSTRTLPRSSSC